MQLYVFRYWVFYYILQTIAIYKLKLFKIFDRIIFPRNKDMEIEYLPKNTKFWLSKKRQRLIPSI